MIETRKDLLFVLTKALAFMHTLEDEFLAAKFEEGRVTEADLLGAIEHLEQDESGERFVRDLRAVVRKLEETRRFLQGF